MGLMQGAEGLCQAPHQHQALQVSMALLRCMNANMNTLDCAEAGYSGMVRWQSNVSRSRTDRHSIAGQSMSIVQYLHAAGLAGIPNPLIDSKLERCKACKPAERKESKSLQMLLEGKPIFHN